MDELRHTRHLGDGRETLLEPVFDRLDVVIRRALDRLDPLGVGDAEITSCLGEQRASGGGERRNLRDASLIR